MVSLAVRGPFAPSAGGCPPPGHVEYLGNGTVRLDDTAISTLAALRQGDDFRAVLTDAGPILIVGADRYLAHEEQADAKQ